MMAAASDVRTLEVYLVPVGTTMYELYCETPDDDEPGDGRAGGGALRGLYARFREMMEEAQEARRAKRLAALPADPRVTQSRAVRCRNWVISWVAQAIADWRLLWRLRTRHDAVLLHPSDLDGDTALQISRTSLQRDVVRHRAWLIVDGILAVSLGPLALLPGPNLIAYYFVFRSVGHLLAWRGARNGLGRVDWHTHESPPLGDLRGILSLNPDARARHVRDVEARLELEHLAAFVERIVVRSTHPAKHA